MFKSKGPNLYICPKVYDQICKNYTFVQIYKFPHLHFDKLESNDEMGSDGEDGESNESKRDQRMSEYINFGYVDILWI